MTPGALRLVLRLVAAAGIPGVIVGSIAGNDAVAITFGATTATAAFGLILVTSVTMNASATPSADAIDAVGADVEDRIAELVAAGAEETSVRALVADAVRLGQRTHSS